MFPHRQGVWRIRIGVPGNSEIICWGIPRYSPKYFKNSSFRPLVIRSWSWILQIQLWFQKSKFSRWFCWGILDYAFEAEYDSLFYLHVYYHSKKCKIHLTSILWLGLFNNFNESCLINIFLLNKDPTGIGQTNPKIYILFITFIYIQNILSNSIFQHSYSKYL
jgi:hypothetical protein